MLSAMGLSMEDGKEGLKDFVVLVRIVSCISKELVEHELICEIHFVWWNRELLCLCFAVVL